MMSEQSLRSTGVPNWGDDDDVELDSYRTYCVSAYIGLGLSVLSLSAFAYPLMWGLPPVGVLVSALALRQIARDPNRLIGRRVALAGLAISLLIGVGAPTRVLTHRWVAMNQTRRFADEWFAHLRDGNPQMALEMTREISKRRPLNEHLWQRYRDNPNDAEMLRKYVREPVVATLLALGDSATVRYYETIKYESIPTGDAIQHLYAVTYEDDGQRRTFFVAVGVGRDFKPYRGVVSMRIFAVDGNIIPPAWRVSPFL